VRFYLIAMVLILSLCSGCATPGIRCQVYEDAVEFTPTRPQDPLTGFLSYIFPNSLPGGKYSCKRGADGTIEATAETKMDIKLIDLNMMKAGD